jgi:hypothetical protein
MAVSALPYLEEPEAKPVLLLTERLGGYLTGLRPAHPVSILDLSPDGRPGLGLVRWVRQQNRKTRLMSYEWTGRKARDLFTGVPEVLVEKGNLPGVHFSPNSFDFVVGVDVLQALDAPFRLRALQETVQVGMRLVLLVEHSQSEIKPAMARELVMQTDASHGSVEEVGDLLLIAIKSPYF